jgi:predicted flap endonuclease-1-like 5' DNA nuclease
MSNRAKKGLSSAAAMGLGLLGGIVLWWWWNRRMEEVEEYLEPRRREALAMPPMQHERVGPVGDITTGRRFETSYTLPDAARLEPEPLLEPELFEEPVVTIDTRLTELDIIEVEIEPVEETPVSVEATETTSELTTPAEEAAIPPRPKRDNFTVLEGIGPVVNELLHSAGIDTFEELAGTDVNRLTQILNDAELPMINPGTWPEQAELAAAENWDALNDLKNQLSGGRRRTKIND